MSTTYAELSHIALRPGSGYKRPAEVPKSHRLDNPALEFMTDFQVVAPVTIEPHASIDGALEKMKHEGVRMLLVVNEHEHVIGVITSRDIQGEKPIEVAEDGRIPRSQITVEAIMTPEASIQALNLLSVRNAQIGHVVETLHRLDRQHTLVVEVDQDAGTEMIVGLFSTSQISKQLKFDVTQGEAGAHSLAEMLHGRT
jgi:CBS-domain-containing membrane protein